MFLRLLNKIKSHSIGSIISWIDMKYGFGLIESLIFTNWFNPLYTLYFNLRSFPLKQAFVFPVFIYGRPRLQCLSGTIYIKGKVRPGMIDINRVKIGAPSNMGGQTEICNKGTIIFHGTGFIGTGNKIYVERGSVLDVGHHFKITDMCNIGCFCGIKLGNYCRVTHRCQVLDSNYHYVANFNKGIIPDYKKEIILGDNVWVCNTTTIQGGAIIPNHIIIASNSLVNKDFSVLDEFSMIGGSPAKFISSGLKRVENINMSKDICEFYKNNNEMYKISQDINYDEC